MPRRLLVFVLFVVGLVLPTIASAATTAYAGTRVGAFDLAAETSVGLSLDLAAEKQPGIGFTCDEIASGSPHAAGEIGRAGGGGGGRLALGVSEHLDGFAARQGATTWKSFPDPMSWKTTMLEKLADPNTKILFNLEGPVEVVEVWPGVSRAARGAGGATDWELLQIQQNPQWWNTIEWWQGGKQVPNPFQ